MFTKTPPMNLKDQRAVILKAANDLVDRAKGANRERTNEENMALKAKLDEIADLDVKIKAAEVSDVLMKQLGGLTDDDGPDYDDDLDPGNVSVAPRGKAGVAPKAWAAQALKAIQRAGHGTKSVVSGSLTLPAVVLPAVTGPVPAHSVLQLIPTAPIETNTYGFLRTTVRENNAAPVADYAKKPTSTFTFEEVEDRARVIAHLSEPFPQRFLQDHTEAVRLLEYEMAAGVLVGIEKQVVAGDGTGENLTGILHTSGVLNAPFAGDIPTTLRRARTALEQREEHPTAWLFNPTDAEALDLLREDGATGAFLALDRVLGPHLRLTSPALPSGTAILADWSQVGLLIREGARMDVNTGDPALFDNNLVKLRAEQRVGLAVRRPQAIAIVHLN